MTRFWPTFEGRCGLLMETGGEENRGVFQLEGTSAHSHLLMYFFTSRSQGTEIADDSKNELYLGKVRGEEELNLQD